MSVADESPRATGAAADSAADEKVGLRNQGMGICVECRTSLRMEFAQNEKFLATVKGLKARFPGIKVTGVQAQAGQRLLCQTCKAKQDKST
jgi:hypothetical protein